MRVGAENIRQSMCCPLAPKRASVWESRFEDSPEIADVSLVIQGLASLFKAEATPMRITSQPRSRMNVSVCVVAKEFVELHLTCSFPTQNHSSMQC